MGTTYNSSIVRDGLTLHLDAASHHSRYGSDLVIGGNDIANYTANQNATITQNGRWKRVVSTQTGSTPGAFPIGGSISVVANTDYVLRIYARDVTNANAHTYVYGANTATDLVWVGTQITSEGWYESSFNTGSNTTIKVGVLFNSAAVGDTVDIKTVSLHREDQWDDISGNGRHGLIEGTAGFTTDNGNPVMNNGSGKDTTNYFTAPAAALENLSSWTVDMWLQRDVSQTTQDVFLMTGAGNNFCWQYNPSTGTLQYQNTGLTNVTWGGPTNGTPFNFVATGSGGASGSISVYIDNSLLGTFTNNTVILVPSTVGQGIVFGQELDANNGAFDQNQKWLGKYYAVKFYDRVLTSDERRQNFEATRTRYGV